MSHDTDALRPETGCPRVDWVFRIDGTIVRWDWSNGTPHLRSLGPRRVPRAKALAKNTPTLVYSHVVKGHLLVESGLERELVEELDGDPGVRWMVAQPTELHFRPMDDKLYRHIPDLLVMHDEGVTIWDVRPRARRDERFAQIAQWTALACQAIGWDYRLFAGHPPVRRVNTMWLAAYRSPSICIEAYADVIRDGIHNGSIRTVGHVAARDSGYGQLIAAMYHLLWAHRLECDLDNPITSHTTLRWVD